MQEHVSAVILLDEGIKINSHLIGWEGYRDMLVPGSPVELVLQDLGENEWRETQVGYAFRLMTGRRKTRFPPSTEAGKRAAEAVRGRKARKGRRDNKRGGKKKPLKKRRLSKSERRPGKKPPL